MEGKRIRVLTIKYNEKIQPYEVPCFRGAINAVMGKDADVLFHNHTSDATYRYAYPMIQYKRLGGNAAIVCVDGAVDSAFCLMFRNSTIFLGDRMVNMALEAVSPVEEDVGIIDGMVSYHIHQWQPLNKSNYERYGSAEGIVEKVEMLTSILKGNILSFCKGIGVMLEENLKVTITSPPMMKLMKNKGVNMQVCDLDFKANINLPNDIGLGKNVSLGYGTITKRS